MQINSSDKLLAVYYYNFDFDKSQGDFIMPNSKGFNFFPSCKDVKFILRMQTYLALKR